MLIRLTRTAKPPRFWTTRQFVNLISFPLGIKEWSLNFTDEKMKKVIGSAAICLISVSAILNLRGFPMMADLGWSSLFFYMLALIVFLIPCSLVCAELATRYPSNGGIYTWTKQAFGEKVAVLVIWMEWSNNIIGFPATLSTIVMTLIYAGLPNFTHSKWLFFLSMLILLWTAVIYNGFGIKASSRLNIVGALFGTLLPGILIIVVGIVFIVKHHGFSEPLTAHSFFPTVNVSSFAILVGVLSAYAGMQVTSFYAGNVKNPRQAYPRALLIAAVLIFIISSCSALAMFQLLPKGQVNLLNGVIESFSAFFNIAHLAWLTPIIALCIALGSIASLSAWLVGPARGLREMLIEHAMLSKVSQLNKYEMPATIFILQGIIGTLLASLFLWMPNFKSAFWLLIALTSQFTVLMYIFLFAAFIYLRVKPTTKDENAFYIPGGNPVAILIGGLPIIAAVLAFTLGLFPPSTLSLSLTQNMHYIVMMLVGDLIILALPFVLFKKLRSSRL